MTGPNMQIVVMTIPPDVHHDFVNTGARPRIATAYAPPEHEPGTVHATKAEADADHHDH
jgi:mannose-6-phosphate isomerase-like protein (cupin superfamily)